VSLFKYYSEKYMKAKQVYTELVEYY
jgi:hypothetical protein